MLSAILSNNIIIEILHNEILHFTHDTKVNNKDLLTFFIYSLINLNDVDYIIEHLNDFFVAGNLNEVSKKLFDKSPKDIIILYKEKLEVLKRKEGMKRNVVNNK